MNLQEELSDLFRKHYKIVRVDCEPLSYYEGVNIRCEPFIQRYVLRCKTGIYNDRILAIPVERIKEQRISELLDRLK